LKIPAKLLEAAVGGEIYGAGRRVFEALAGGR